ncbi:MAG: toll/interleukin-1 receptor domain-containing protein, partial [Deltaproteobacteria bacterium]|nr:toll/interleukin-1 receptor domain-containing protein [Deltaproteobacteria bacterium]
MKKIFISYSHQDEKWKDRLVKHLSVFQDLEIWDDRRIEAGDSWRREIENALNAADVAVLMISADFLTSKFILEEEIPRLLKRRKEQGLQIIPVIVHPCAWDEIKWLNTIQTRPKDRRALSGGDEYQIETDLTEIAKEVKNILKASAQKREPPPSQEKQTRYFVEINKSGGKYTGAIHQGSPAIARPLDDLQLHKNSAIPIKGKPYKIGALLKALNKNSPDLPREHDERAQLDIGQYLYDQIFNEVPQGSFDQNEVDLRIITSDPHITLLPWNLMANRGIFLSPAGWSFALSNHANTTDCRLPKAPKVLIVAPQPVGMAKTGAESHLEAIEDMLLRRKHGLIFGQHMEFVDTWEDFIEKLETFQAQILYYYGHCAHKTDKTSLCFASGKKHKNHEISASDFADRLRKTSDKPLLVYLNCLNNPAGLLEFGLKLGELIPAVITGRHAHSKGAARSQGLSLLEDILTKGKAPHKAVSTLYGNMDEDLKISTTRARWMTPLIFCRYGAWKAGIPEALSRRIHDPYWHLKIDRIRQFSMVSQQTMQMLKERKPGSLSFVWYGAEGQGIDKFHHRLNVELREYLINFNTHLFEVRPEWPTELEKPDDSFRECLKESFQVKRLDDIPAAVRNMSQGVSGKQTLIYVRHLPVTSSKIINPRSLKMYLKWWDEKFVPLLERHQFALLGVSFIVKNPPKFRNLLLNTERLEDIHLSKTVFRLLDE